VAVDIAPATSDRNRKRLILGTPFSTAMTVVNLFLFWFFYFAATSSAAEF
jgi:hypothetical protein